MGFLQRLFGRKGQGARRTDQFGHYLFVQCGRCGAVVRSRIDLRNDLSPSDEGDAMLVRKVLIDDRCFRPIETRLRFNRSRALLDQSIEGGAFIDEQTFNAVLHDQQSTQK